MINIQPWTLWSQEVLCRKAKIRWWEDLDRLNLNKNNHSNQCKASKWVAKWEVRWATKICSVCKTTCNQWEVILKWAILLVALNLNNNNNPKDFSRMLLAWMEWTISSHKWVSDSKTIWWWEVDFKTTTQWLDSNKLNNLLFRLINRIHHNLNRAALEHSTVPRLSNPQVEDSVDSIVLLHKSKAAMILVLSRLLAIHPLMFSQAV